MSAVGIEDELPKEFGAQIDNYYQKLDALRKKQAELKNSDTISEEQKADLIAQTNNVNKLTEEIGGLISEYQRLSGDNVDPTTIRTNMIQPGANMDTYEQQLKNYVREITNGKGQIKGFNAETKTLTYTVKTGAHEFTTYTAAVRHLDNSLVSVRGATKKTETFLEATARKMKEISSYMSGMALLSRLGQELRRGIQYVRDIDLALTELKKVTDETEESYDRFLETAAKTADKVGSTIQKVVSSTADWARLNI
jgi:chromosome segregation ATPase